MEEEVRIDVVKKNPYRMEITITRGGDMLYKHTIELNPEIFSEEEAEQIMNMWSKLLQIQVFSTHMLKDLGEKFFRLFFGDEEEEG